MDEREVQNIRRRVEEEEEEERRNQGQDEGERAGREPRGRKDSWGRHVLTFLEYSRSGSLSCSVLSPADAAPPTL